MDDITALITSGNELFSRVILAGEPDWQAEARNIPDDAYPDEEGLEVVPVRNRTDRADATDDLRMDDAALAQILSDTIADFGEVGGPEDYLALADAMEAAMGEAALEAVTEQLSTLTDDDES